MASWRWQVLTNRTSSPRLGWLACGTLFLWIASSSQVAAQTPLVNEMFKDSSIFGWSIGNQSTGAQIDPCLTAGNATTPVSSIPACGGIPDAPGTGVLRLTTATENQATFVFYNYSIPLNSGLDITFNYFSYGGRAIGNPPSPGDGITFFLFDGNTPNNQATPGAFGGSLGYAQKQENGLVSGLVNAYIGVGLDEFGGFANDQEGRGTDSPVTGNCAGYPAAGSRVIDSITIRGSGNDQTGYCFLANSGTLAQGIDVPNAVNRNQAARSVRILITPNYQLSVFIDFTGTQNFPVAPTIGPINLLNNPQFPNQAQPPTRVKFGFAASNGIATNIHEVTNLGFSTRTIPDIPSSAPDMTLQHQQTSASFTMGKTGQYRLAVRNVGLGPSFGPVRVTDKLPTGFSLASFAGNGWNCSENRPGTVICVYIGDPLSTNPQTDPVISPGETQTVLLTLKASNTPGTYTNTATVTTTGDTNRNNNRVQTRIQVLNSASPPPLCNRVGNVCQF